MIQRLQVDPQISVATHADLVLHAIDVLAEPTRASLRRATGLADAQLTAALVWLDARQVVRWVGSGMWRRAT